jgi:hypothetical protein
LLNSIEIDLRSRHNHVLTVYIDVENNSLSQKWVAALTHLIENSYHLEKNYCWLGWAEGDRSLEYICGEINRSIAAVNTANLGYVIEDVFTAENTVAVSYAHLTLPTKLL